MATKPEILEAALDVLREGDVLTLDAVAVKAGLTKPGVVHHFATKGILSLAVLDHLLDQWEVKLRERAGQDATPTALLRAYVEYTLLGDMDAADLALLADQKQRESLVARCTERMDSWFGELNDPRLLVARLVADGAWIDSCLGLLESDGADRVAAGALVSSLIDEAVQS